MTGNNTFMPTGAHSSMSGDNPDRVFTHPSFLPGRRTARVVESVSLAQGVHKIVLEDEYLATHTKPAQFANLYSNNPMYVMPRPFGVCDVQGNNVSFIFAVIGEGTREFSQLEAGDHIDVLGPLGNGYNLEQDAHYILVGGGLGVPPLIRTAQVLQERSHCRTTALLGYRDKHFADDAMAQYADDVYSIDNAHGNVVDLLNTWHNQRLEALQQSVADDISLSNSGDERPISALDSEKTIILSCGPHPMMKAVAAWAHEHDIDTQVSLESRMGCGYGTCVVCVTPTVDGLKKVCLDGPVFTAQELDW